MSDKKNTGTAGESAAPENKEQNPVNDPKLETPEDIKANRDFLQLENSTLVSERQEALDSLAKEKESREKAENELAELKKKLKAVPAASKAKKSKEPLVWTDKESGERYTFTRHTPERFNHMGKNKTQEDWIQDDEAMQALIHGRSSFVKPFKN